MAGSSVASALDTTYLADILERVLDKGIAFVDKAMEMGKD